MHIVLIILGGTLAGAAAFTGILLLIYWVIGGFLLKSPTSDMMFWLGFVNLFFGVFVGAGLGLVGALQYCGFAPVAHFTAVLIGLLALGCCLYEGAGMCKPTEGWPQIYTWRQGAGVVFRCSPEIVLGSCCILPLPFIAALGLIVWVLVGR